MSARAFVVVGGRFPTGDVSGCLLHENGEVTHSHMSSSASWLKSDLTENFGRRAELEDRYPDGYEVVFIDRDDEVPADVMAANSRWAASQADDEVAP